MASLALFNDMAASILRGFGHLRNIEIAEVGAEFVDLEACMLIASVLDDHDEDD